MSSIINNVFPCPFCGKTKTKIEYKTKTKHYPTTSTQVTCSVRCNCCHARGSTVTKVFQVKQFKGDTELEQLAIDKWNTRYKNGG
jgi:Lar family restriction alleviation protein